MNSVNCRRQRRLFLVLWWTSTVLTLTCVRAVYATSTLKSFYSAGQRALSRKDYMAASHAFRQTLPLFTQAQKKRKPKTKSWHLMTLGACDVLYHLAKIAMEEQQYTKECLWLSQLYKKRVTLPKQWSTWNIHPALPGRLEWARTRRTQFCPKVPTRVSIAVTPTQAVVEFFAPKKRAWSPVKGGVWEGIETTLMLRIRAKGFRPMLHRAIQVPRWRPLRLRYQLQPLPSPVVRPKVAVRTPVRRPVLPRPPKAVTRPFYRHWAFWTVTGVVVVGAATATVLVLSAEERYALQGTQAGQGFRVWKPSTN